MARQVSRRAEQDRLAAAAAREANWQRWGPYLAERQWGTVREDYSPDGSAWDDFPHEQSRSRAYRWGEDGLLGITDRQCRLCFALALWNGQDAILKERLFGLTGPEGNHGEDVKELYFYLDSTPTHSYCKASYLYPHAAYPYGKLVEENRRRGIHEREFELLDSGVFDEDRYFEVVAEYAKADTDDLLCRITVTNHGPQPATLHLLPTLWFRNTWIWGCRHDGCTLKPRMAVCDDRRVQADHETLGRMFCIWDLGPDGEQPALLVTENETNTKQLYGTDNYTPYVKDAFHHYLIGGRRDAVNPKGVGTKCAAHYRLTLEPGETQTVRARLYHNEQRPRHHFGKAFDDIFTDRINEADAFYSKLIPRRLGADARRVKRQAYAGLLWTKQFYHYIVDDWLKGDEAVAQPPDQRWTGRNHDWRQVYARDVLSMPDKWEYPWFAVWDTAFHMIPFASIDPQFAKDQLVLFLREWYMHPNGAIPAYEFAFGDVNPPVHAWACWQVYKMTGPRGKRDRRFLASVFQKLLLNFTWWVNRKDLEGNHLFAGGFLGLDNIGVFDRSQKLPGGGKLHQADGTAWMAFYCHTMLAMALELAQSDRAYADMASKFFEHFVAIADAVNTLGGTGLWDEQDGFYYDHYMLDHQQHALKVRSLVGLVPLIAVEVLEQKMVDNLPGFKRRTQWFLKYRPDLAQHITFFRTGQAVDKRFKALLAIPSRERLERILRYMLDENEFLSPYGLRSLSKYHEQHPYEVRLEGQNHTVRYTPGESDTTMFGGNSNWRGPVWFPINFLIIEALLRYHHFYGDDLMVECPTGSGNMMNLRDVACELGRRLTRLFLTDDAGRRPYYGACDRMHQLTKRHDALLFHEYFHGDTGEGLGASHQTGWTALVSEYLGGMAGPAGPPERS
jgi:hypothetical protein